MRRLLPVLIFIMAGACVACDPPPPTPEFPVQKVGSVHAEGNSVMFQTYYGSGVANPFDTASFVIGASADYSSNGYPAVERVPTMVAQGDVSVLVWDLGLNEIFRDQYRQWSTKDQNVWFDILMNKIPEDTCVVMVNQWVLPSGYSARPLESMISMRGWVEAMAETRENTVLVDWKPILEANPQFSPVDGTHIAAGSGGAEARDAMYREGVNRCGIA